MCTFKKILLTALCMSPALSSATGVALPSRFQDPMKAGFHQLNDKLNSNAEQIKLTMDRMCEVHKQQTTLVAQCEDILKNSKHRWPQSARITVLALIGALLYDHSADIEQKIKEGILFCCQVIDSVNEKRAHYQKTQAEELNTVITVTPIVHVEKPLSAATISILEEVENNPFYHASQRSD